MHLPRTPNTSIVDSGCGAGAVLQEIAALNPTAQLVGLDVSETALAAAQSRLPGAVSITGFVNQSAIGKYYTAADLLVLPSLYRETWGLVVNEAMNFGLPAVVSDRVGCAPDLIRAGETGATFQAGSASSLYTTLNAILRDLPKLRAMGEAAHRHIAQYDLTRTVEGVVRAAYAAVGDR
ncbi:MAG: glycosyltransferase [Chloroflexi bacterium]|nr:glycosyltransferase [Chloroflexota bacterium]